jgi:sorbitol-specific phosphotransferase system component IIA
MLTIEGTYKNGQVVLGETPTDVIEAKVLVTFLDTKEIDLAERGINQEQAAELRARFGTIAEDWNRPEMDIYDVD